LLWKSSTQILRIYGNFMGNVSECLTIYLKISIQANWEFYLYKGVTVCDILTYTITIFPFVTIFTITDRSFICIFTFFMCFPTFLWYTSTGIIYNYFYNINNFLYLNSISINLVSIDKFWPGRFLSKSNLYWNFQIIC
jgi:hypothetical protein